MKDSFLLYTEIVEQVDLLTDEQAGKFIKAVLHYKAGTELPQMDGVTAMVFAFVRQKLDRDAKKYDEVCEKHRQAGAKGGRPKKANGSDENQEKPNGFLKTKNNQEKHDNEHEHEHDNEHGNNKTLKRTGAQMVIDHGFSDPVQTAVLDWLKYKTEKRQGYKETGLKSLLTSVQKRIDEYGEAAVIRCIEDSMAAGWQGIVWDRIKGKPQEKKDRYAEIRSWFTEDAG